MKLLFLIIFCYLNIEQDLKISQASILDPTPIYISTKKIHNLSQALAKIAEISGYLSGLKSWLYLIWNECLHDNMLHACKLINNDWCIGLDSNYHLDLLLWNAWYAFLSLLWVFILALIDLNLSFSQKCIYTMAVLMLTKILISMCQILYFLHAISSRVFKCQIWQL